MMLRAFAFVLLLSCAGHVRAWTADNGNGTFTNPLFYDELADPDVIRVGTDFYLTGSSMHAMPGLAVLHSRDLVNWDFQSYALDRLDLGSEYRLEDGLNVYGQGIWAPSFRFHDGTFYIFANVNGKTTQMFRAKSAHGPWTRTAMNRSFHDLSVLFDDDGSVYIVWGYRNIHIARLNGELTDIVPGSERLLIEESQGMGEGLHLYKIDGRYYLTSAWYLDIMRMPVARADKLTGPWEVNQNISRGEQFGQVLGWRLSSFRPPLTTPTPYTVLAPDPTSIGRMALHQGGIVDTPSGEWWGVTMGEENAVGRVTALSPITWKDGWPYFGLPGNFGRTPRTWIKPNIGMNEAPRRPYERSDEFSGSALQPVWQWNHVPVDDRWSLTERPGFLRLHSLAADNLWDARNTLTQRSIGPRSIPTAVLETAGLKPGDSAGLALLIQPDAWIGVSKDADGTYLTQHDGQVALDRKIRIEGYRVWLRADCDYASQLAKFSYSLDGRTFHPIGDPFRMVTIGVTFQGVRYALFSFHRPGAEGGFADFDSIQIDEPSASGFTRPIPFGQTIRLRLRVAGAAASQSVGISVARMPSGNGGVGEVALRVVDRKLGRVALGANDSFLSVDDQGHVALRAAGQGRLEAADSPGPEPNGPPGVRFDWDVARDVNVRTSSTRHH